MMGISTQTITVDLSKQLTRPQVVRLGQGDKRGTTLVADIYENGVAYNLNGKTARFSMRAPDGTASYSVIASSYSGNKATFDIDETYAASIAGKTDTAYIEVLSGSTVICSTSRITVVVYRSASQGLPVSGAYSDALEEAIAAANTATAEVREAMGDISELAVPLMSANTRGGAKLGSGLAVSDGALSVSPIPNASIDSVASGDSQTGAQSLSLTGLSRLWAKMRAAFAAMSHVHSADDVTSGTLPVARGGTGVAALNTPQFRNAIGLGIYASLTNQSTSLTLTTSAQKVPLHGSFAQYGGCSESGNGIKVPVAGVYLITGLAYFTTGFAESDMIHADLRKNGSSLGDSICRTYLASAYQSLAAPTRIVSLAANDIITLHAWNQTAARGTVESRNGHGIMLVKIA